MGLRDSVIEALGGATAAAEDPQRIASLKNELRSARLDADSLQESFAQLELAMEEQGWRRFGALYQHEFSRSALENLILISQMMYMVNPLIKRAVNVRTYYTWGQGVETEAKDDKIQEEVVEPMNEDEGNQAEYFSHHSRLLTHVDQQVEGNLFFRLPTDMLGNVSVRSIPTEEIRDIHAKPGDRQQIWFYRRVWTEQEFDLASGGVTAKHYDKLYPDYRYDPVNKPSSIGDMEVMWDEPIIHQRTGGLKGMQFGVPETYAALDWARAYKRFLEDWHTIVKSLSEFAWKRTTTGEKMAAEKAKFESKNQGTVEAVEPAANVDPLRNRSIGGVALTTAGDDLAPIPKSGATVNSDDARPSRLMVAAAMDLPDTILSGDVDIGNFATSKTLDRPTELSMVNEQLMWKQFDQKIYQYAIKAKVRRGQLSGSRTVENGMIKVEYSGDSDITIKFPPVLEHDVVESVKAIVSAATLEGRSSAATIPRTALSRELMNALSLEDIDELLQEVEKEQQERMEQAAKIAAGAATPNGEGPPQPGAEQESQPPQPTPPPGAVS